MRRAIIALAGLLASCGQPATTTTNATETVAQTDNPPAVELDAPSVEHRALVGQWSFDRSCGLYDLVLNADGSATFFDYTVDPVVTNIGTWADAGNHRTTLTLRRAGRDGAPSGDATTYNLDVTARVTDDLSAFFGPNGATQRTINAKRCPEEDRE
ncbi:MAG: hypothetical protein HY054_13400 [Proteobacteria bacterium]|nr:hypothetical protein [Pseudomonadota bacterium]